MEKQPMKQPSMGGVRSLQTMPGVSIPLSNEIAAVLVGQGLTHPDTTPEGRAEAEKRLSQLDKFKVVYAQNTADEMNVVVPYFPDLECKIEKITEEQLEEIAGGELFISVGTVGLFFAKIGLMLGVSGGAAGGIVTVTGASIGLFSGASAALGCVMAGVAASALVVGAGLAGAAIVGTGVGVGIAAGVGAFGGGGGVSVGHAS